MKRAAADKYLRAYAEPEAEAVSSLEGAYSHAVVIPVAREGECFFETLDSLQMAAASRGANPIVLVVVNGRRGDEGAKEANQSLFARLVGAGSDERFGAWFKTWFAGLDLMVCPRFEGSDAFGPKDGVGRARKIGADTALGLIRSGAVASPWIRSTDADVVVPPDYFDDPDRKAAAFTLPFFHEPAPESLQLYEISLRYYVLGLKYAGSPYAFHTIGSTLGLNAQAYAQVRGFPRRLAAEDFYILNKLAKVGPILRPRRQPLLIRGRESDRVPFGTGRAMTRIATELRDGTGFQMYAPESFTALRRLLEAVEEVASKRDLEPLRAAVKSFDPGWSALGNILDQGTSPEVLRRQLHGHFDAFRTLKWVHHCRDHGMPSLDWREALARAPFLEESQALLKTPREALMALEDDRLKSPTGVL